MLFVRLIHCGWSNHKENEQNICIVDTAKESSTLTYWLRTIRLRATHMLPVLQNGSDLFWMSPKHGIKSSCCKICNILLLQAKKVHSGCLSLTNVITLELTNIILFRKQRQKLKLVSF